MDKAISRLLSFPPQPPPATPLDESEYDKHVRELTKQLALLPAKHFVEAADGKSTFDIFDPSINSLPYLYALLAHISAEKEETGVVSSPALLTNVQTFINAFDPVQVRYAGHQWRTLVEEILALAESATDAGQAARALSLVQTAMIRLDPSTSTFTSTHLSLVRIALHHRAFNSCMSVLDNDIFHLPVKSAENKHIPRPSAKHVSSSTYITTASGFSKELTYRDPLQYFLFGAMVYIARRNWTRAFLFLELVLVSPVSGNTASMIQVEAYKKWLLVGTILKDRPPNLPRTVSPQTNRYYSSLSKPYTALTDAYKERAPRQLLGEYKAGLEDDVWTKDNNHGLVKIVVAQHRRAQILSFSKTYSSIPVEMLAQLISEQQTPKPENPAEVEQAIRDAVATQSIFATLTTDKNGNDYLRFLSPDGKVPLSDAEQAVRLKASVVKIETLNTHVKDAQRRLELTKDYITAAKKRRQKDAQQGLDGEDMHAFIPGAMDEDALADM